MQRGHQPKDVEGNFLLQKQKQDVDEEQFKLNDLLSNSSQHTPSSVQSSNDTSLQQPPFARSESGESNGTDARHYYSDYSHNEYNDDTYYYDDEYDDYDDNDDDSLISFSYDDDDDDDSDDDSDYYDDPDNDLDYDNRKKRKKVNFDETSQDQQRLKFLRQFLTCSFTYLAIGLPILFYILYRTDEVANFEKEFDSIASTIIDNFSIQLARTITAVESLSTSATSYGTLLLQEELEQLSTETAVNETNSTTTTLKSSSKTSLSSSSLWPFVTLLDFGLHGSSIMSLSNTINVGLNMLVYYENRLQWERYASDNLDWYWDAKELQQELLSTTDMITTATASTASSTTTKRKRDNNDSAQRQRRTTTTTTATTPTVLPGGFHKEIYKCSKTFSEVDNDNDDDDHDYLITNASYAETIYDYDLKSVNTNLGQLYIPRWQSYPFDSSNINFNLLSEEISKSAITTLLYSKNAVLSKVENQIENSKNNCEINKNKINYYSKLLQKEYDANITYENEPISTLYYPIFDTFVVDGDTNINNDNITTTSHTEDDDDEKQKQDIVAIISTSIFWPTFFHGILPPDLHGVIIVIKNECDDIFSIEIDEDGEIIYLGPDDYHEKDYDYVEHSFYFTTNYDDTNHNKNSKGKGVDLDLTYKTDLSSTQFSFTKNTVLLDENYCSYSLHIYPTDLLHEEYITKQPYFVALGVFFSFIFISMITLTYDCIVQRRVQRIFRSARENYSIMSKLFPTAVVSRLQERQSQINQGKLNDSSSLNFDRRVTQHPKALLRNFLDDPQPGTGNGTTTANIKSGSENLEQRLSVSQSNRRLSTIGSLGQPIADLFPFCTVMFADISGFSAWNSEREPEQVFILLETIFRIFDKLAKKLDVFKVETIADTYVAVTGLPDPQNDHAPRMAKFARECLRKVNEITKKLEATLGPGTGDLKMRFGLHSGQVTGGVLFGEKCRFQLFGDTMNFASRMESTSHRNRIQISVSTANLLKQAGKEKWIRPREAKINVKGKGLVETFWLLNHHGISSTTAPSIPSSPRPVRRLAASPKSQRPRQRSIGRGSSHGGGGVDGDLLVIKPSSGRSIESLHSIGRPTRGRGRNVQDVNETSWGGDGMGGGGLFTTTPLSENLKNNRLIDWFVELLAADLKRLIAERVDDEQKSTQQRKEKNKQIEDYKKQEMGIVLDEVVDVLDIQKSRIKKSWRDPNTMQLDPEVSFQLHDFVSAISQQYNLNPFHNFEHASHMAMSSVKLFNRIVTSQQEDFDQKYDQLMNSPLTRSSHSELEDLTFGITSDPLIQFAITFSSLIHDVDHAGVPNDQLIKENPTLGARCKNESVAEQNSIAVAWKTLMNPLYKELRECIFTCETEQKRFRQYVVCFVMATDLFNENSSMLRNERWDKVFNQQLLGTSMMMTTNFSSMMITNNDDGADDDVGTAKTKATVLLEHLIQAADISHTMQHWNIYKKWNERLFLEMYSAFSSGRVMNDPSLNWYGGELSFFDNYVIPLAQKIEECGTFGVSGGECLNCALENRKEWALKGQTIVKEMSDRCHKRKMLEIGGFTSDEIENFSSDDLEHIIRRLTVKGLRGFGFVCGGDTTSISSFSYNHESEGVCGKQKDTQKYKTTAHAWFHALELYERSPASHSLQSPSIIFTVFSGLLTYMKGGLILQDKEHDFELNLVNKFVRDAKQCADPIHYLRAIAGRYDMLARNARYLDALDVADSAQRLYDPTTHSKAICATYGIDFVAQMYAHRAICYHLVGNMPSSNRCCVYILNAIYPLMDLSNFQNIFDVLFPVIRVMKNRGKAGELHDLLHKTSSQNGVSQDYNDFCDKFICFPIWRALSMLLEICHDPDKFQISNNDGNADDYTDDMKWLLVKENGIIDDFLDKLYGTLCWSPNSITAELCLRLAKKILHGEHANVETAEVLLQKGLVVARKADKNLKNADGTIISPCAYEVHEPVLNELLESCRRLDLTDVLEEDSTSKSEELSSVRSLTTGLGLVSLKY